MRLRSLSLLAAFAVACGVPTFILQQYDGPPRAAQSVAIVRFEGTGTTDLVTLDGSVADAHVPDDARLHVEMLPGRHVLGVANRAVPNEPPRRVVFTAEAGRLYQVALVAPGVQEWSPRPRVFELDARSGAPVRDVTEQHAPAAQKANAESGLSAPSPVAPAVSSPPAAPEPTTPPAPAPEAAPEPLGAAGARGE